MEAANRDSIAFRFHTDYGTTHRILMNLNYGFFASNIPNPVEAWKEAHPDGYHRGIDLDFVEKHFVTFASKQFSLKSGWSHNLRNGKYEWQSESYYRIEPIRFEDRTFDEAFKEGMRKGLIKRGVMFPARKSDGSNGFVEVIEGGAIHKQLIENGIDPFKS